MVTFLKKSQQREGYYNYFPSEDIYIKLKNPKVSWVDFKTRSVSFVIDDFQTKNHLKKQNEYIYKNLVDDSVLEPKLNSLYYQKSDSTPLFVKCKISKTTKFYFENSPEKFNFPNTRCSYDEVLLKVKNAWSIHNAYGISLEIDTIKKN